MATIAPSKSRTVRQRPDVLVRASPAEIGSLQRVLAFLENSRGEPIFLGSEVGDPVTVPSSLTRALERLVRHLSRGSAVTLLPYTEELTSQVAADLLGMSRPTLIALVDAGRIEARWEGSHRRIPLAEVLAYRSKRADGVERDRKRIAELSKPDPS